MSRARSLAAGMLVAAVAVLATAAPASAHDSLISSTPAVDERFDSPPESVSLTFSDELLTLGEGDATGSVILVVDAAGTDWVADTVTVTGNTASVALEPDLPDAGYQVRWQVISADGHPITGVIPFTVGDAEPMSAPDSDAGAAVTPPPAGGPESGQTDAAPRALMIGLGGAALAVTTFVVILILRRRKTAPAAIDAPTAPAADEQL